MKPSAGPRLMRTPERAVPAARFWLPLRLCPTLNDFMFMHWSKRRALKLELVTRMLAQSPRRSAPLGGRPTVLCVRYSSKQPDQDAAWTKLPVDALKCGKQGLGLIRDDSPEAAEIKTAWERAPNNGGGVLIEVYAGRGVEFK